MQWVRMQANCSTGDRMRLLGIVAAPGGCGWMGRAQEPEPTSTRVHGGKRRAIGADQSKLEKPVREELGRLVGQNFSQQKLEELKKLIHKTFPDRPMPFR